MKQQRKIVLALAAAGLIFTTTLGAQQAREYFDPVLEPGAFCGGNEGKQPALLKNLILVKNETAPFQPVPPKPALDQAPVLYKDLGKLTFPVSSKQPKVQAWFDQGLTLAFGFNHAEAIRSFRAAQKLDPDCAMCFWGEALATGPNINVTAKGKAIMSTAEQEAAYAALEKAKAVSANKPQVERDLIDALATRYAAQPVDDRTHPRISEEPP